MKSRSHRLPVANPQDDWVDGSWTVDCVCGVNFDDGEEMVNCDDCGVWVHTRCVRYVKSEKLFACDKCKNKARRNDSEETEVAQLLVELPTKTLRMNPPCPNNSVPIRRPFRLWTDLPMEERVHVQGVPGGDPSLFSGLSSVFGRELWKCSGYVPKKFNFQYREFPCWENEANDNTSDRGNEMTSGNGAGTLFSLSKENCLVAPVGEKPVVKSNEVLDSDATTRSTNDLKKGTSLLGPSMIQGSKRKKEEFGMSKDQSGKKKSKIIEKEGYLKKDAHPSRPDRGPMAVKTDIQRTKVGNSREALAAVDVLQRPCVLDHDTTSCSDIPASSERFSKNARFDVSKRCSTSEAQPREDKIRNHVPSRVEDSPIENGGAATILERSHSASLPMTGEVVTKVANNKEEVAVLSLGAETQTVEPIIEKVTCLVPDNGMHQNVERSSDDKVISSSELDAKLIAEVNADPAGLESQCSDPSDGKLDITKSLPKPAETTSRCLSEKAEVNTTTIVDSEHNNCKLMERYRRPVVGDNNTTNTDELPNALCQSNQERKISEVSVGPRKSSGQKQSSKPSEDAPRSSLAITNPQSALNHRKVAVSMGKSSSVTTKSSAPESQTSSKAHDHDSNGRPRGMSERNLSNKRDSSSMDEENADGDEERRERPKKMLKEPPKSSVGLASKIMQSTKLSHASVKTTVSEAMDEENADEDEDRRERPKKMLKEPPKSSVGRSTKLSHASVKTTVSEAMDEENSDGDEDRRERPKKMLKEPPKSSVGRSTKLSHASVKTTVSEAMDEENSDGDDDRRERPKKMLKEPSKSSVGRSTKLSHASVKTTVSEAMDEENSDGDDDRRERPKKMLKEPPKSSVGRSTKLSHASVKTTVSEAMDEENSDGDEDRRERPKKMLKEPPKSSVGRSTKLSHASVKTTVSEAMDEENSDGDEDRRERPKKMLKEPPKSSVGRSTKLSHASVKATVSEAMDEENADGDEERRERPKKMLKEPPKSSVGLASKIMQSTKLSHASVKTTVSEAKDPVPNSSAKLSIVRSNPAASRSAESSTSLQSESASHVHNKDTGTHLVQKAEKINQPSSQPSSKVNTHLMHPPSSSSPAALSDEELALLLHQELNSSPRVPRVPRMRHAGSLPQLTSPTGTSMLMKRTSSGGGKDHGSTSRRKSKDVGRDGSNCSQEVVQETKKSERSCSPGVRREEDSVIKRERDAGSAKNVQSLKKSNTLASNTYASSLRSPNEANEQNLSSMHSSPSTVAVDDAKVVGHPSYRTLPGLLAEIMSKGQRMTYEELCNAVLPHWPNLRKHNGDRYAYSSHSQAVLDCLRNRIEWARLVDRGPKTSTTRKRRKVDVDSQFTESEDNEDGMDRASKDVRNKTFESNQEEFPKGKRKARKRRRLALQGRGIKDVRRRHRAEVLSDEDIASVSESGEDSMFSEDEVHGGETSPAGNEASASSDER